MNDRQRNTFSIGRALVVRGISAVYLIAFVSWWVQFEGLTGEEGLAPVGSLIASFQCFVRLQGEFKCRK